MTKKPIHSKFPFLILDSRLWLLSLTILGFILLGLVLTTPTYALTPGNEPEEAVQSSYNNPDDPPAGLTSAEWEAIHGVVAASEYHFSVAANSYTAPNLAQGWQTTFTPRGVQITPPDGGWSWGLRLVGYGYSRDLIAAGLPTLSADLSTITYQWDVNLSEWWFNSSQGLEQGFTLLQRPGPARGQPLYLDMAVTGDLMPVKNGSRIVFVDENSQAVLTYNNLHVTDAKGQVVPSRLEVGTKGSGNNLISIVVDDATAIYPLTIDPWLQTAKLYTNDAEANQRFGTSVVIQGDTVVVGAIWADSKKGAAFIFKKPEGGWVDTGTYVAKLTASGMGTYDWFGYDVALDGDTIVVGTSQDDSNGGTAYVYVKPETGWATTSSYTAKLTANGAITGEGVGENVAVAGDTIALTASGTTISEDYQGAAYVYVKPETGWVDTSAYTAKLYKTDGGNNDHLGSSIAVVSDTVVLGCHQCDVGDQSMQGAVYIYKKPAGGWTDTGTVDAILTVHDGVSSNHFGQSFELNGDTILAGATGVKVGDNNYQGAAYIYEKPDTGWETTSYYDAKLTASDGVASDQFGWSVSLNGDKALIVCPERGEGDFVPGKAYIFEKPATGWATTNVFSGKLTGADSSELFGNSKNCSAMGEEVALVGADGATVGEYNWKGVVHIYKYQKPEAHAPKVTNTTTTKNTQTKSGLTVDRNPLDGTDVTHFQVTAIQDGDLYQNDGSTPISEDDFISVAQGQAGLKFTPDTGFVGEATFKVQSSLSNSADGLSGDKTTAKIEVVPGNVTTKVDPENGGTLVYTKTGATQPVTVTIEVPPAAVTQTLTLVYSDTKSTDHPAPATFELAGGTFTLDAYLGTELLVGLVFSRPVTIILEYDPASLNGVVESTLEMRYWNGTAWSTDGIVIIDRDTINHRLTLTIEHLTEFALLGKPGTRIFYMPILSKEAHTLNPMD